MKLDGRYTKLVILFVGRS